MVQIISLCLQNTRYVYDYEGFIHNTTMREFIPIIPPLWMLGSCTSHEHAFLCTHLLDTYGITYR